MISNFTDSFLESLFFAVTGCICLQLITQLEGKKSECQLIIY